MRTSQLAVAILVFAAGIRANVGVAEAQSTNKCNCPKCQAAAAAAMQQAAAAQQQAAFMAQEQAAMAGGVQQAGMGMTTAFPANGHPYGPPRHSYSPDARHPGRPFDGGWYGMHGSPHGTPGYPGRPHHMNREYVGPQGPPTAAVAYPYYTTRGPRDLVDNPPTIGR